MPREQKAANVEGLEDLTIEEMIFCECLLKGMTASDAYRHAFKNHKDIKDASIWAMASRLKASVKVQSWLHAARLAGFGATELSVDNHVSMLAELREVARASGNMGAAVQAEVSRGKVAGHYVERIKDETERASDDELVDALRKALGDDIANAAIAQLGAAKH